MIPWGEGIYRRRIRLVADGRHVRADLEDDFHRFGVALVHDGERVVEARADARRFPWETCTGAGERVEAVLTLLQVFVADPAEEADDDEIPVSMRRALPVDAEAGANESNVFRKAICQSEKLSERFIAGVVLLDVVSYSWKQHNFEAEESNLLHVSTCNQLVS